MSEETTDSGMNNSKRSISFRRSTIKWYNSCSPSMLSPNLGQTGMIATKESSNRSCTYVTCV